MCWPFTSWVCAHVQAVFALTRLRLLAVRASGLHKVGSLLASLQTATTATTLAQQHILLEVTWVMPIAYSVLVDISKGIGIRLRSGGEVPHKALNPFLTPQTPWNPLKPYCKPSGAAAARDRGAVRAAAAGRGAQPRPGGVRGGALGAPGAAALARPVRVPPPARARPSPHPTPLAPADWATQGDSLAVPWESAWCSCARSTCPSAATCACAPLPSHHPAAPPLVGHSGCQLGGALGAPGAAALARPVRVPPPAHAAPHPPCLPLLDVHTG